MYKTPNDQPSNHIYKGSTPTEKAVFKYLRIYNTQKEKGKESRREEERERKREKEHAKGSR